jgi:riboflavin kinase/FMN adenylyltransferase
VVTPVCRRGRTVSSSEIRRLIQHGQVSLAARLLERPYALEGAVVKGRGIGSQKTVPTLNLAPGATLLPASGVYVTRTRALNGPEVWPSVTNVGCRPTFGGDTLVVETFLLGPLEGAAPPAIRVEFLRRLRGERRFPSPEELRQQILRDAARAQTFFRRLKRWARSSGAGV